MLRGSVRPKGKMMVKPKNDSIMMDVSPTVIDDDKTEIVISALNQLKTKIKNKK